MTIQRGDYVRPNNPSGGLPRDSVWRVVCADGGLRLEPENDLARHAPRWAIVGCRFPVRNFDKVVLCRGQWVDALEAICLREPASFVVGIAKAAKADKEAAAKAKMEEARKALAAKLHADRCLAEAGLELIAEVSRLNTGGDEQLAHASIAKHAGQLQELAKSYGYRIVKPSMLAQVVKL